MNLTSLSSSVFISSVFCFFVNFVVSIGFESWTLRAKRSDLIFVSPPSSFVFFRVGVIFFTIVGLMIANGSSRSFVCFVRFEGDSLSCCFKLTDRFDELEPRTVLRRIVFSSDTGVVDWFSFSSSSSSSSSLSFWRILRFFFLIIIFFFDSIVGVIWLLSRIDGRNKFKHVITPSLIASFFCSIWSFDSLAKSFNSYNVRNVRLSNAKTLLYLILEWIKDKWAIFPWEYCFSAQDLYIKQDEKIKIILKWLVIYKQTIDSCPLMVTISRGSVLLKKERRTENFVSIEKTNHNEHRRNLQHCYFEMII